MDVNAFNHTKQQLCSGSTIHVNIYNLKRGRGFDGKFPFDCLVILYGSLSDKVIFVNAPLLVFQKRINDYCFSIASDGCHLAIRGIFKNVSQENTRAPGLFSVLLG